MEPEQEKAQYYFEQGEKLAGEFRKVIEAYLSTIPEDEEDFREDVWEGIYDAL